MSIEKSARQGERAAGAPESVLDQAIGHHRAGRLVEAERLYRRVLRRQPNSPVALHTTHEIFSGFPKSVTFEDELYWNLQKGDRGKITILGETTAPGTKGPQADQKWLVF